MGSDSSTREEMLEMALLMYVTAHEFILVSEGFETEDARRMTRRYRIAREALEWDRAVLGGDVQEQETTTDSGDGAAVGSGGDS